MTTADDVRRLIDIKTLAELLGVQPRYVRRLVQERRVPYLKCGHYVRFELREIDVWLDETRRPQLRRTLPPSA